MPFKMTLLAMAFAALTAASAGSAPSSSTGRIAFATDRAPNLRRAAIYSVEFPSGSRRLVARPEPPLERLVRSPNGKAIAYTRTEGSTYSLFVSKPSGTGEVRIGQYFNPVFSRDGSKLAVTSGSSCGTGCYRTEIVVVRVDGTGLHTVAQGSGPSWSPDGRRLVYQAGSTDIRVVRSDGQGGTLVATGSQPQWAPRGNRIVFVATRQGYGAACFVSPRGSDEGCTHGFSAKSILWAPDGRSVAFRHSRSGKLGIVDAHGRHVRFLRAAGDRLTPVAWSPDGSRLAFLAGGTQTQILACDLRGRAPLRQVTSEPKLTYFSAVQWRNGRISYVAVLNANDLEIAVMNGDESGVHTITHNQVRDQQPVWSPDGRELAFARTEGPAAGIRIMDADGFGDRLLTHSGTLALDDSPAWSPDGRTIAFIEWPSLPGMSASLRVIQRDGNGLRQLSSVVPAARGLSWSPDGASLVVAGRAWPFVAGLFVVDVRADTARRLETGSDWNSNPSWSPDGSTILFAGRCASACPTSLYEIGADGTGLREVVARPSFYTGSAWTSDGRILFSREFTAGGITSQAIVAAAADGGGEVALTNSLSVNIDPAWTP